MSKILKINRSLQTRDRQSGEIAIILLVVFGLISMLGIIRADDDSSKKSDRQERRSSNASNHGKGSSTTTSTPKSISNSGKTDSSVNLQSPATVNNNKPSFTPQFPQLNTGNSHRSNLRMTAEKENPSTPEIKRKPILKVNPPTTDHSQKLNQGRSLPSRQTNTKSPILNHNFPPSHIGVQNESDSKTKSTDSVRHHRGNNVSDSAKHINSNLKVKATPDLKPSVNNKPGFNKNVADKVGPKPEINHKPNDKLPNIADGLNKGRVRLDKLPTAPKPDLKIVMPKQIDPNIGKVPLGDRKISDRVKISLDDKLKLSNEQRQKISTQHHLDFKPNRNLKHEISRLPIEKNGRILPENLKRLNLQPRKQPEFQTLLQQGKLLQLTNGKHAQALQLNHQFQLLGKGDVARQMNLAMNLHHLGGWQHRNMGIVSPAYTTSCMSYYYPGPSYCPSYCWYPVWSPWVDWCSWDYCDPWCDPRPIYCRPIVWNPCPTWVWWECPTWEPLPIVTCGTWVDVPVVTVVDTDLQMLAVRFVDAGHAQQERGPRYRVWFRNNSPYTIDRGFNVMLLASEDPELLVNRSEAGVRVDRIEAGQVMSVDIRLPEEVNFSSMDETGNPVPFRFLSVQVDSHNELIDTFQMNNGVTLARGDVLPIDPASFAADPLGTAAGAMVNIAGEGFGPEPGQVLVQIEGVELQGEIEGWYDLGVRIRLPEMSLTSSLMANVVVIRGDGAASNPLAIEIAPVDALAAY